jgi:hypothetical protein
MCIHLFIRKVADNCWLCLSLVRHGMPRASPHCRPAAGCRWSSAGSYTARSRGSYTSWPLVETWKQLPSGSVDLIFWGPGSFWEHIFTIKWISILLYFGNDISWCQIWRWHTPASLPRDVEVSILNLNSASFWNRGELWAHHSPMRETTSSRAKKTNRSNLGRNHESSKYIGFQ